MERWNLQLKEKELATAVTVLFLLGVLLGFLCLKLIGVIAGGEKIQVDEAYLKQIAGVVPGFDLYLYTVWIKLKNMFLYFLLALTWLNLPYTAFLLLRQGFLMGYLLSCLLPQYHLKGLWVVFAYYFPQFLVAVPLWGFCFTLAWHVWKEQSTLEYNADRVLSLHKFKLLNLSGKRFLWVMAGCFAESALEVWIGTWFLKKALEVMI